MKGSWPGWRGTGLACAALLALAAGGCSGARGVQKNEKIEEGLVAAQRAAQADAAAQAQSGAPALQGTTSPIPSLVPGEGRVQLPAAPAPPPTAPQGDKFSSDDPAHLLARCKDRAARHEWFDAVGDCRRSYELDPSSVEPQFELMRLLVELQSFGDAEAAALKVLAARPDDPVALYYLAWSYSKREQYPNAIAALKRAIALDPKRSDFVQALGKTYCLADDYGRGIATLEHALQMRPGDAKTQNALSSARAVLADRLAPYQKLVKEKPQSVENQAALGFMYQKYGLPQRALSAYDTSLSKLPTPLPDDSETKKLAAQIYYNRGVVYRELGKPDLAEPALWQAMQLDTSLSAFAWYYIGLCRYDAGKFETSIDALRKSIDLAPDVADNRMALADACEKAGKADLAAEQRNAVAAIRRREATEKEDRAREEADGARAEQENRATGALTTPPAQMQEVPDAAPDSADAPSGSQAPPAEPAAAPPPAGNP